MQVPILGSNGWVFPKENPVIDLEVERLAGRQQGVVRVHVVSAKELKSYDTLTGAGWGWGDERQTHQRGGGQRVGAIWKIVLDG